MKKTLKVVSIIMIVFAAIDIALSVATLAGGGCLSAVSEVAAVGIAVIIAGVIMLCGGVFQLISGIMGLGGSNGDLKKVSTAIVLGWITLICNVVGNISNLVQNFSVSTVISFLIALVLPVLFLVSAIKTKAEING